MQTISFHTVQIIFHIIAFILLVLASIEDVKAMQIPNWITNSFVACCGLFFTLLAIAQPFKMPLSNLTGAFIVALPMFLFSLFKEGSIGGADIRIIFGLGLLVGASSIIIIFVCSTVIAFIVSLLTAHNRRQKLTLTCNIPYVPFVIVAYTVDRLACYY